MIRAINSTSPSFKGHYIVQVNKQAFDEPDNAIQCQSDFFALFAMALKKYDKRSIFDRKEPVLAFYEAPEYNNVILSTPYGLNWINNHTKIEVKPPMDDDYYSFVVLTGKEKDAFMKKASPKNIKMVNKMIQEEAQARRIDKQCADETWVNARRYQVYNTYLENVTKNSSKEIFKLEELMDIIETTGKLDLKA